MKRLEDKKLQYDIHREAAKKLALSSGKIDEEILPLNQRRAIEQAKFTYSLVAKTFEKQVKSFEDLGEKEIKALAEHWKQLIMSSGQK